MADLIIKPTAGSGNKLIFKDQAGNPIITTADSGGTIDSGVTWTSPVINTGISGSAVLDEDAMGSNSATKIATQQSIKAYVDTADALKAPIASPTFTGAVTLPASSFGDANITNVGSIALDSIIADGTSITISSDMETAITKKIKQKGAFMQSSTNQSLTLGF